MRSGELRHKVTIQEPTETPDSLNTPEISWRNFATVWAAVEPLHGREYLLAQNTNTELTVRIRIRYLSGVKSSMRVLYGSQIFEIKSPPVDVGGRRREMHLMCMEVDG